MNKYYAVVHNIPISLSFSTDYIIVYFFTYSTWAATLLKHLVNTSILASYSS